MLPCNWQADPVRFFATLYVTTAAAFVLQKDL